MVDELWKMLFLILIVCIQSTLSSSNYLDSNMVNHIHLSLFFFHREEIDFQAEAVTLLKIKLVISWLEKKSIYVFLLK